ncbi:MAG TPA: SIMPL domain-containing protein [Nitrosopumilaceae archaeon]|nr:SIMPL domain-containing protein [Nitrosopumilaceae archaeon]
MNKVVSLASIAGIVLILAFAVNLTPAENQATAQTTPFPSREKVISVTGTASTSVEPDLLIITFGVETQEKTAKQALGKNSQLMNSVVSAIQDVGISEDELSTSRFNIQPVYDSYRDESGRYTQELIGYRVSNSISVETTNLNLAADIIDSAVGVGANRIDSVYFTLSPEKQLQIKDDLIGKAVLNAKSKAENALSPLNHKIIGVKAVSLSEFGMPPPMPMFAGDFAMAEGAAVKSTPVFSSEQDVSTTASVIFLIGSN